MSKLIWSRILLFLVLLAAAYDVGRRTTTPEKLEWPLASVEETTESTGPLVFYGETNREFFVEGDTGVPLSKLVDLSIFGDFRPAMTEHFGSRFYELESARIELADEFSVNEIILKTP